MRCVKNWVSPGFAKCVTIFLLDCTVSINKEKDVPVPPRSLIVKSVLRGLTFLWFSHLLYARIWSVSKISEHSWRPGWNSPDYGLSGGTQCCSAAERLNRFSITETWKMQHGFMLEMLFFRSFFVWVALIQQQVFYVRVDLCRGELTCLWVLRENIV